MRLEGCVSGERRKGKRFFFVLLLLSLLLTFLEACSYTEEKVRKEEAVIRPEEEVPTLIWWMAGEKPVDYEAGIENINAYLEEKLQIRLELRFEGWGGFLDKTQDIIYDQEYFDIMFVDTNNFGLFASMGALQDITDLIHAYAPKLWEIMPELIWSGARQDGRIYAVPTYKDSALTQYWIFEKRYLEKYNIDIDSLQSWSDLDAYFRMLKRGEGETFYPVLSSREDSLNIFNEYDSFTTGLPIIGVKPDDAERRVVCLLEEENILEKLEYLRQWYLDGLINPNAMQIETLSEPRPFFCGIGWPGAEHVWQQDEGSGELVAKQIYGPIYSKDSIQGAMNAVYANSRYKKEALELLELVNTDQKLRDMLAYGVEGRNFEYNQDGTVHYLNRDWNTSTYTQGNFLIMSPVEGGSWEGMEWNNKNAEKSVLLEFEMDLQELEMELSACKEIWNEYALGFAVGAFDLEKAIPECMQRLRKNGLDTIISEAQKQIDAQYGKDK
ncbi:MAG TPA: ABC transporter substrate-binding protein [Candidatus Eisenbergiella merdavium]|uniref:ABC transporter substrate-binding protein n=1 Tax=Candidatus Eisenbergiella merdavium TaxID=2838551 RepID=A0A9D2NFB5_9FIRM|nr:ABC transporter substrate-binding protein [Candidatus Eisenbergiella merdavium]